jgi:hypothetical protein
MKKTWDTIEKILSLIQVFLGIIIVYININIRYQQLDWIMQSPEYSWSDVSWVGFFKTVQFMLIVGLLFIVGGILLFLSKRTGWISSVAVWITFGFTCLNLLTFNDVTITTLYQNNSDYWIFGSFFSITIISLVILVLKPLRTKYTVDEKTCAYVGGILLFFLANKLLAG